MQDMLEKAMQEKDGVDENEYEDQPLHRRPRKALKGKKRRNYDYDDEE